ncbi:SDR family oxidoreductase [Streptomyces tagetis]|uniref:SDR family oxidoreductase n=1 Tax=Streptomyces tagetis TaxID=2820809 RepID=A0A940XHC2_9ACTN|nr:SDR family oxidoreductase [Streptomyces sp. RG38]MBQ0826566.1 SDR family oxidoreductase [Streptomyces sp. RG38]
MPAAPTVLLTGASGVLGTAISQELAHCHVIALTHRAPCPTADEQITGDLTAPYLGLDRASYAALASRVDTVVHGAAVTGFAEGPSATHRLNESGTRRMLEFAADAGAVLHHLSTAFVARHDLTRANLGRDAGDATARPEDYLDSKRAAEAAIRDSGQPAVIVRPSVVIGDSVTGEISAFQGMHGIIHALLRGLLPLVPVPGPSRVDFVPCDVVARAVAALVTEGRSRGEVWLTAGESAPTAERLLELTASTARHLGIDMRVPRMVGPDMIDRLIRPVFISSLHPRARRRFDDMLAMTALFADAEPFPSSLDRFPATAGAASPTRVEAAYVASVAHLARARKLIPAAAAVPACQREVPVG